jgi:membrane protein DedA with SNARE-associated domain
MVWKYGLVFIITCLFDIVPFPLPPAFTAMAALQIIFDLNVWAVIILGVAGSVTGRFILMTYIPKISGKIFKASKSRDVEFLGKKMKEKGWKSQVIILAYTLLPLPSTPLFVAGGMAKIKPVHMLPAFIAGKFISDAIIVLTGKFASENATHLKENLTSWKSIAGLLLGLLMLAALLFIDWRTLVQKKKLAFKFKIFK